jgi:hypothetical protein
MRNKGFESTFWRKKESRGIQSSSGASAQTLDSLENREEELHVLLDEIEKFYRMRTPIQVPKNLVEKSLSWQEKFSNSLPLFSPKRADILRKKIYLLCVLGGLLIFSFASIAYYATKSHQTAGHPSLLPAHVGSTPTLVGFGGSVSLYYEAEGHERLSLRKGNYGELVKTFELKGQKFHYQLQNSEKEPILYTLEREKDHHRVVFVLPGSKVRSEKKGQGTALELALAVASYYSVPVEISLKDKSQYLSWEFKSHSPEDAPSTKLSHKNITLEYLKSQIISISQN